MEVNCGCGYTVCLSSCLVLISEGLLYLPLPGSDVMCIHVCCAYNVDSIVFIKYSVTSRTNNQAP